MVSKEFFWFCVCPITCTAPWSGQIRNSSLGQYAVRKAYRIGWRSCEPELGLHPMLPGLAHYMIPAIWKIVHGSNNESIRDQSRWSEQTLSQNLGYTSDNKCRIPSNYEAGIWFYFCMALIFSGFWFDDTSLSSPSSRTNKIQPKCPVYPLCLVINANLVLWPHSWFWIHTELATTIFFGGQYNIWWPISQWHLSPTCCVSVLQWLIFLPVECYVVIGTQEGEHPC